MDRLIDYFTEYYPEYHLQYATPSDYVDHLNSLDHQWPVKSADLFPYND